MGFLERAIRRGVSEGIGRAVGDAITRAVEPSITEYTNKAANHLDSMTQNKAQSTNNVSGFEGAFANFERAAQDYATKMSENIKVCSLCNKVTDADKAFCPECGNELPKTTVAQGTLCPACNRQNAVGTKFCSDCGTKLPATVQQEETQKTKDEDVMKQWDETLPFYPKWICGGCNFHIEHYGDGSFVFFSDFRGNNLEARQAVEQYRKLLVQNGFHQAGQYPTVEHLYKKVEGVCYHADTEHCFEGDSDCPSIGFDTREPLGGYDYVKPQEKKQTSFKDLFGF